MKNKTKVISVVLFLSVVIIFVSCGNQKAEWKGTIEEENGVTVVKNPKEPMFGEDIFSLEEELSIGGQDKGTDYVFEYVRTIRVDDEENIYVLDMRANSVKVFDKNGKHIRNFGREGQGPGEFRAPGGMHIIFGKEIMISSIGRISFFSLQGEFLRHINQMLWDPNPIPDSEGNIIARIMSPGKKFVEELKKFNSNLEPMFTIVNIEREPPFPKRKRDAFPTLIYYIVLKDDSIVWGFNNKYLLMVVNKEGKATRKIIKDYNPIKITEEEKEKFFKERRTLSPEQKERYEFPENYPAFRYISTDDEGRIFVRTYESDDENNRYYDVFDSEGRYITKIALESHPTFWKKKKLYCVKEDMEGLHLVKRYKVTWKH